MNRWSFLAAAAAAAALSFFSGTARADVLSACNGAAIFQGSGTLDCTMETSGGCTAKCTPPNFQVACTGQLEASCSGGCTASATATCSGSCSGNCTGSCTANQGSFSCQGSCQGGCEADCSGTCMSQCATSGNTTTCTGQCQAECKASCGARCSASCQGTPPSASCQAQCSASCSGECDAQANLSCDVSCQDKSYLSCTSMLTGGCQAQCQTPKGALFCNGQFINVDQSSLDNCVSAIEAEFNIKVSGYASASCSGDQCNAQAGGSASASCDMAARPPQAPPLSGAMLALGLGAVVAGAARRRAKRG